MVEQLSIRVALFITLAIILCCQSVIAASRSKVIKDAQSESDRHLRLPKMFQFDHYKSMYNKSYASLSEELMRKKIFLAKAFRAFISGVAYKFRKTNYFLALNQLSDMTRYEIRKTRTLHTDSENGSMKHRPTPSKQPDIMLESEEDVRKGVENIKIMAAEKGEKEIVDELSRFKRSGSKQRRKRSTAGDIRREFSFSQLVERRKRVELPSNITLKIDTKPVSNNPNYKPPKTTGSGAEFPHEPMSPNLWGNLVKITPFVGRSGNHAADMDPAKGMFALLTGMSSAISQWLVNNPSNTKVAMFRRNTASSSRTRDRVYADQSSGGCMFPVRDQSTCGACYAFAVTAFFEWLHCKKTGRLVAFSEQYIIDCGPASSLGHSLHGCSSGLIPAAAMFFQIYGADTDLRYPYRASDGGCPYNVNDEASMGYYRFYGQPARHIFITMQEAETLLTKAPALVIIGAEGDFFEYGGGVHSGEDCCRVDTPSNPCDKHGVLLVGHGQQDGQEYWLIRNSYSTSWGEEGYYKLSKRSDCILANSGMVYGTMDGKNFELVVEKKRQ